MTEICIKSNDELVGQSVELSIPHVQWLAITCRESWPCAIGKLCTLSAESALTVPWNIC